MSRKILFDTIIIVIVLCFLISIIIVTSSKSENNHTAVQTVSHVIISPTEPPSVPQTSLKLFPNPALPDSQGNIDIDVSMNTYNNRVTATQFMIQYDPAALEFKSIRPDDAFYNAKIVVQDNNEKTGIVTYSMKLPPQLTYNKIRGNYDIAEIEFATKHQEVTTVKFLSASVTSPDSKSSVLKSLEGTTVKVNQ